MLVTGGYKKESNMNKIYILSGMDKEKDFNFYENIAGIFRKDLQRFNSIVYISAYPKDIEKNKKLSRSEKFINIGIEFKTSIALDYSYSKEEAQQILAENDLIFLYGGDPYQQMEFILDYDLKDFLKSKTIIALSAGSINICPKAICTKDEDFSVTSQYSRNRFSRF